MVEAFDTSKLCVWTINPSRLPKKMSRCYASHPLHRTCVSHSQSSSAVLGWPGDGDFRAQNAVTLYVAGLIQNVSRSSSKASSLYGAVYCSTIIVIVIIICCRCVCTNVCMYTVNAGSEPYLTAENTRAVMCLRGSSKFVGVASISFRFSIY